MPLVCGSRSVVRRHWGEISPGRSLSRTRERARDRPGHCLTLRVGVFLAAAIVCGDLLGLAPSGPTAARNREVAAQAAAVGEHQELDIQAVVAGESSNWIQLDPVGPPGNLR